MGCDRAFHLEVMIYMTPIGLPL